MLSLQDVHKAFGPVQAVRGISLDIPAGQIVGILGPNGAGKTTSIRIITGVLPPSRGKSSVDGFDSIEHSIEVRRRIGYLPESAPLYREMRVESYLRYRASLYSIRGRRRTDAVNRVLSQCHLIEARRRRIGELSKGYRQRVGLAAALVHDPPLLILDEPTTGLDPAQIAETRRLMRDLAGERTMLVVSHILPEVEKTCDRIVIFARGRVQADGTPRSLLESHGGPARFVAEIGAPNEGAVRSAIGEFAATDGLAIAAASDGWWRCTLTTRTPSDDPRAAIAGAAARAGLGMRELRRETASLEEFYIRVIELADGDSRADAPDAPESCA